VIVGYTVHYTRFDGIVMCETSHRADIPLFAPLRAEHESGDKPEAPGTELFKSGGIDDLDK
jgi:hypothetical protein